MANFCRELFCALNETFRGKIHSVLEDYIGAKVTKEVGEFFILLEIILLPRGAVCWGAVGCVDEYLDYEPSRTGSSSSPRALRRERAVPR